MSGFLSVITSDIAIVIYLSIAIIVAFFFVVKFMKKNKAYKIEAEEAKVKEKEQLLSQSLANDKRG